LQFNDRTEVATLAHQFNHRTMKRYTVSVLGKDYDGQDCALARALETLGERWTLLIVRDAFYGVRRFGEFQTHLDIPRAVLADRLRGLVADDVLRRIPDPERSGSQIYELTAAGRDLWPALHALLAWGDRHRAPNARVFKHATCATRLTAAGACPACGITPPPQDILTVPRRGARGRREDPVAVALRRPHRLLTALAT
jgi:DNA-binding HxlR family transcriptional regulator